MGNGVLTEDRALGLMRGFTSASGLRLGLVGNAVLANDRGLGLVRGFTGGRGLNRLGSAVLANDGGLRLVWGFTGAHEKAIDHAGDGRPRRMAGV